MYAKGSSQGGRLQVIADKSNRLSDFRRLSWTLNVQKLADPAQTHFRTITIR